MVCGGVPKSNGLVTFEGLSARIHPQDLDRVRAAFAATRDMLGAYEIDFRILHGDEVRWISARGRGEDQGIVGRIMFAIFLDVSQRKLAEEARESACGRNEPPGQEPVCHRRGTHSDRLALDGQRRKRWPTT